MYSVTSAIVLHDFHFEHCIFVGEVCTHDHAGVRYRIHVLHDEWYPGQRRAGCIGGSRYLQGISGPVIVIITTIIIIIIIIMLITFIYIAPYIFPYAQL